MANMGPREIVTAAYDAIGRGDLEAFLDVLDDDVVLYEPDGHPAGGTYKGKAEVQAAFPTIAASLGLRGVTLRHLIVEGDRAVALADCLCTSKSGVESTMPLAESWLCADGKAIELKPYYWDTAALVELAK